MPRVDPSLEPLPAETPDEFISRLMDGVASGQFNIDTVREIVNGLTDVAPLPAPCIDNHFCVTGPQASPRIIAGGRRYRGEWGPTDDVGLRVIDNATGIAAVAYITPERAINLVANILLSIPDARHQLDRWFEEFADRTEEMQAEESKNNPNTEKEEEEE